MAADLTSEELSEWAAYYKVEPFGPYADQVRFASIYALLANVHRKAGAPTVHVEDLMPKPLGEKPGTGDRQSVGQMKRIFQGIAEWAKRNGLYRERAK